MITDKDDLKGLNYFRIKLFSAFRQRNLFFILGFWCGRTGPGEEFEAIVNPLTIR